MPYRDRLEALRAERDAVAQQAEQLANRLRELDAEILEQIRQRLPLLDRARLARPRPVGARPRRLSVVAATLVAGAAAATIGPALFSASPGGSNLAAEPAPLPRPTLGVDAPRLAGDDDHPESLEPHRVTTRTSVLEEGPISADRRAAKSSLGKTFGFARATTTR